MKVFNTITAVLFCSISFYAQNTFRGTLVAENKQPVPSANVILLSLPDSTFIKGAISNDKGIFELLNIPKNDNFAIKITHLEYKDKVILAKSADVGTISLEKATNELGEVVVSASKPILKQKGTAIITDIATSKLKQMPKMEMLLNFLPGVSTSYTGGGYEVFGKGNPIFFVNNRRIYNIEEINRIPPQDIESIELETQPGAEFDNSVGAIIYIKLKKKQGDGLSGTIISDNQYLYRGFSYFIGTNFNYRKGKTDIFIDGNFDLNNNRIANSSNEFMLKANPSPRLISEEKNEDNKKIFFGKMGFAHEFNEKHSAGASLRYDISPFSGRNFVEQNNKIFQGDILQNDLQLNTIRDNQDQRISGNIYYEGKLTEKIKLQTDVDYIQSKSDYHSDIFQKDLQSSSSETIISKNKAQSDWVALKSTLTQEFDKLRLSYGAEFSHLMRDDRYENSVLSSSFVENKEIRSSGFVSGTYPIGKANVKAGIRYEFADFQYFENQTKSDVKSRMYRNWLPNVSVAFPWDKTQFSLSYQKKILRPAFHELGDYNTYETSFLYARGNPYLMPRLTDEASVLFSYKNLSASVIFSHHHNSFYEDYRPFTSPNVVEKIIRNYDDFQTLKTVVSLHHTIGRWTPKIIFTGGKQFGEGIFYRNDFLFNIDVQNNIQLSEKWLMLLYGNFASKGSLNVVHREKSFGGVHLGFAGNFLNNSLNIYVIAQDIFNTFHMYNAIENPFVRLQSYRDNSGMRSIKFGIEYNFNPTRNKYKGQDNSEERL